MDSSITACITPNEITRWATKIIGLYLGQNTMVPAIRIFQEKRLNLEPFFTKVIPLEEGFEAFNCLGLDPRTMQHHEKSAMKGYEFNERGESEKVPQVGDVLIEDDVEIGADSTVDRARIGSTRIGRGTKIDNLVMIAHNVVIGPNCLIVAQTGIAGGTVLGERVIAMAQAGFAGHLHSGTASSSVGAVA